MCIRLAEELTGLVKHRFQAERQPETRGIAVVAIAKEVFSGDADDGDGMTGEHDARADERGVTIELRLPYGVADDGDGRRALAIVFGCEQATGEGFYAHDGVVVSGDEADL